MTKHWVVIHYRDIDGSVKKTRRVFESKEVYFVDAISRDCAFREAVSGGIFLDVGIWIPPAAILRVEVEG